MKKALLAAGAIALSCFALTGCSEESKWISANEVYVYRATSQIACYKRNLDGGTYNLRYYIEDSCLHVYGRRNGVNENAVYNSSHYWVIYR